MLAPIITATILVVLAFPTNLIAEDPYTLETLRLQREAAKWQNRDLIYNNDGGDMLGRCRLIHQKACLMCVAVGIIGSQVDSLFYCVDTVGMVYYDSQVSEVFTTTDGRYCQQHDPGPPQPGHRRVASDGRLLATERPRGHLLVADERHARRFGRPAYFTLFPKSRRTIPDWIMGSGTSYGAWSAFDFGQQGVRDLTLDIFTEICTNYDVDGIELDFLRHPFFFRSHAFGGTATKADLELMTQLVRDIRTMTEQVGLEREKPFLVSVRVPDSIGYAEDIGLDVTQWLEEDLFDMMTVSCRFRAEEWSESVALGHQYDVPVYAGLSESRMTWRRRRTVRKNEPMPTTLRASEAWEDQASTAFTCSTTSMTKASSGTLSATRKHCKEEIKSTRLAPEVSVI